MAVINFMEEKTRRYWRRRCESAGWKVSERGRGVEVGPVIYIVERNSGYTQVVLPVADSIKRVIEECHTSDNYRVMFADAASILLNQIATNSRALAVLGEDLHQILGYVATGYIVGTQTYELTARDKNAQFGVLGRRGKLPDEYWIRPAGRIDTEILAPHELMEFAALYYDRDYENYPSRYL